MANVQCKIKVHIAWWLRWYLTGMVLMCWLTRMQPDQAKMEYWIKRAMSVRFE